MRSYTALILILGFLLSITDEVKPATIGGELNKWHPITVDFNGPSASESDDPVNPFLDYRLTVDFISPSGRIFTVPGFFAGNGQGGSQGTVWRARFSADEVGRWRFQAQLRSGDEIAVNLNRNAGDPVAIDGADGEFNVLPRNTGAQGFLRYGRLEYVGSHYMKFRDGPYWIKGGTDSPENLLGYAGFDGTVDQGGINPNFLHDYSEHQRDFNDSDPNFRNEQTGVDGRGLIGALNYLGEQGVNSVYFLPMNLGGDGQETYPFVGAANNRYNKTHYDISKLYQWNLVLDHAQRQGIALNVVLSETEEANERWLDNGELGVERKLFFRELIARFGYLLAIKWNLGEENDFRLEQLQSHADYIRALDWSNKPIAVHTHIDQFYRYGEIVGDPRFSASSIQYSPQFAGQFVEQWRRNSANAGHPWILDMDENTNGLGTEGYDNRRKEILYDVLFSGGNIEWYFGYSPLPVGGDIDAGNFRYREGMWQQMRYAREMMQREMPFWQMQGADELVRGDSGDFGGAEVFALDGEFYAVYLPASNGSETLNMRGASGLYRQRWFDPRSGQISNGNSNISPSDRLPLGNPPSQLGEDWVVLINRTNANTPDVPEVPNATTAMNNSAPSFRSLPDLSVRSGDAFSTVLTATDDDGTYPVVTVGRIPGGMRVEGLGNGRLRLDWQVPTNAPSNVIVELVAIDAVDQTLATRQLLNIAVEGSAVTEQSQPPLPPATPNGVISSGPRFTDLPSPRVQVGEDFKLTLRAVDDHDIAPVVTVGSVPSGMLVDGLGDGLLRLTWRVPNNVETRSVVELIAIDALDSSVRNQQQMIISVVGAAEVNQTPANPDSSAVPGSAPIFLDMPNVTIRIGEELSMRIEARDDDGIPPAIVLLNSPDSASLRDNGDGTRTFSWRPGASDEGERILSFIAQDHSYPQLSDTMEVVVNVIR